ncbi:MAG: GNAT family N-acetyltransferase [Clostridia bacterium]|nr:GNAT family N-acetyltransferase [Clostridia bacterium]
MIIKQYEEKYKDDLIAMVRQAKAALGRVPSVNPDLFDVKANYFDQGTSFWIAVDDSDSVVGCIGYSLTEHSGEAFLHRLFVLPSEKRKGIGTSLLKTAEEEMKKRGITVSLVHLGEPKEQWFESYRFYPKHGYREYAPRYMKKEL